MEEADQHQILQTLNQFIKPHVVKKVTQLLISLSVFITFFSYSPWLSFLLHSFNFYFSTFPFQKMLSYTTDRNCIFLLCNGILVFLARNSSLITSSSSGSDYNDHEFLKKNGDYNSIPSEPLISESKELLLMEKEAVMENTNVSQEIVVVEKRRENYEYLIEEGGEETEKSIVEYRGGETESGLLVTEEREEEEEEAVAENEEDEKEPAGSVLYIEEEDDYYYDGDDEEEETLSTEELNKKFDDFIRRMKEEIRIQSQQLILV